ncbi:MAG: hypothetical protein VX835_01560 [Pseudomonadota bacterium]|nr:hypothetical protein [Pseudomonadota bacterium]
MSSENTHLPFIYYPISLIAAIFVGFDVAIVSYLYTYTALGVFGGITIALSGFLLNTYVYHEEGPATISHLLAVKSNWWSVTIDVISILGGLLILFFTYYAYAALTLQYAFLKMWFIPFFVNVMAVSYLIATFALNKSGFLQLLEESQKSNQVKKGYVEQLVDWVQQFNGFMNSHWQKGFGHFCINVIVPLFVATVVTYAYTHVFMLGALALGANWHYKMLYQCLIWVSSASFFIGELYFNSKQNLSFMKNCGNLLGSRSMYVIGLALVILANAVANAFIALDASLVTLTLWGGLRFFCGGIQSFCTMSARCILEFKEDGWSKFTGNNAYDLIWWTSMVLTVCAIVYLCQVSYVLPLYQDPMVYSMCLLFGLMLTWPKNNPPTNLNLSQRNGEGNPQSSKLLTPKKVKQLPDGLKILPKPNDANNLKV